MKNPGIRLGDLKYFAILSVALFVTACSGNAGHSNQSTVSVVGTGTVMAQPDMIRMNISLSNTAPTTRAAQEEVGKMVRQALTVLSEFSVEDKNIITASLTFSPEYEYRNNRRVLIGQNARQTITFSIEGIQSDSEKVSRIIDRLVQINGIELNQMDFSVKDNTGHFIKSRELAFRKAADKAKQYAELSGLKVGRVLSISEDGSQQVLPVSNRMLQQYNVFAEATADMGSTMLPSGELEITTRISVIFLLE